MAETDTAQEGNNGILRRALGGLNLGGVSADDYGSLIQEESKAKGDVAKAEQEQKRVAAQGKATAEKSYATGLRQEYQKAEPTLMSASPKFNVTKDTQEGLTGLAALMTVGSLIIGSKGATSGTNAMNAMTGVLKGYHEGNKERVDFETKKYEQSIKDWERSLQQTKESLSRYEKLAATDLSAATSQAAADAASKGQEVIAAKIRQEGITQTKSMVDKLIQQTTSAKTQWATINGQTGLYSPAEIRAAQEAGVSVGQIAKSGGATPAPIKIMKDGKTVYADRSGQPILDKEGQPIVAPDTRTASSETRYSFNVAESMGQAIQDLKNVQLLPKDSVLGTFAGITGSDTKSISDGLRNAFARTVTDEDSRLFEQMIGGLESNMARALGGGYASSTTSKNIEAYRSQVAREGDTPVAKGIFLARMRQELDTLSDFFEQRPGAGPFVSTVKKYQQLLHEAVPFTVDDVIRARSNIQSLPIGIEGEAKRRAAAGGTPPQAADSQKAIEAFGAYDPNTYEYGVNPETGKFARRRKAQ